MQIELICDSGTRRRNDTDFKKSEFCDEFFLLKYIFLYLLLNVRIVFVCDFETSRRSFLYHILKYYIELSIFSYYFKPNKSNSPNA